MNVAMPTLQHHFGTSLTTIQWAITAYTLALAAVTPLSGWLSDRLTSKWAFGSAIVLFTIFSVACSLASSVGMLITFRALQGLAGGIVGPVGMALSWQLIPQDKRGSLMAILGLPLVIAPIAGPILSGWLLQHVSWRAIFLINVPVGILAVILVLLFIPQIRSEQKDSLDWVGLLLAPAGFLSLLYGVHELGSHALTTLTTGGLIALGAVLLTLFVINELRVENPLMAIHAFKSLRFSRGMLVSWLNQIILFGTTLLVPLFLQTAKGFTALHAGEMMAPQALASFVGMIIGGRLFDKFGVRAAAVPGISMMGIAVYFLSQITQATTTTNLVLMIVLLGIGQGMSMMQISTYNLSVAPKAIVTRVTPMINATQQIVNSLSVVLLTNVLSQNIKYAMHHSTLLNLKANIIVAYGHTFLVPLGILVVSLLIALTLSKPKKKA